MIELRSLGDEIKFDPEKETIILKLKATLKRETLDALYLDILEQMKNNVVILPPFMDVIIIPKNTEILVEKESKTDA